MLQALTTLAWECQAFCTAKLDLNEEVSFESFVGDLNEPYQVRSSVCNANPARLLYTSLSDRPGAAVSYGRNPPGETRPIPLVGRRPLQTRLGSEGATQRLAGMGQPLLRREVSSGSVGGNLRPLSSFRIRGPVGLRWHEQRFGPLRELLERGRPEAEDALAT
jgi:hypothetical protein